MRGDPAAQNSGGRFPGAATPDRGGDSDDEGAPLFNGGGGGGGGMDSIFASMENVRSM